jgi:Na+(H+)/acetate symporter ActP
MDLTFLLNGPVTVPAIIAGLINCAAFVLLVYFIAQQKTELIIMFSVTAAITLAFTIMFVCLNYIGWNKVGPPNRTSLVYSIENVIIVSLAVGLLGAAFIDLIHPTNESRSQALTT